MEAILARAAAGEPDGVVRIDPSGRMTLHIPGQETAASCLLK
jgi:hypothetical protein